MPTTHDEATPQRPARPAWLGEDEGTLNPDGALYLYRDPTTREALEQWATRLRDKPEVRALECSAQGLSAEALRALEQSPLALRFRDVNLDELAKAPWVFEGLETLAVEQPPRTEAGRACLAKLPRLRELSLFLCGFDDDALRFLAATPRLEKLSVRSLPVRGRFLEHLARPEALQALALQELSGAAAIDKAATPLTRDELAGLARCTDLRSLALGNLKLAPDALAGLAACTRLEDLSLVSVEAKKLDPRPLVAVASSLRALSWGTLELPAAMLDALGKNPRFEALRGYGRGKFATGTFGKLAGCARLAHLEVSECSGVSDGDLAAFAGHGALVTLGVGGPEITDAALPHLAALPSLEGLTLRKTSVTDAGVARLAQLAQGSKLYGLDLRHTPVTDACVPALAAWRALSSVGLGKTKVSKKGVAALQQQRPDLEVSTYGG